MISLVDSPSRRITSATTFSSGTARGSVAWRDTACVYLQPHSLQPDRRAAVHCGRWRSACRQLRGRPQPSPDPARERFPRSTILAPWHLPDNETTVVVYSQRAVV